MTQLLQESYISSSKDIVYYNENDNMHWYNLYSTQLKVLNGKVHERFLELLDELNLPEDHIPQLYEVSNTLIKKTGWVITKVDGLISYNDFFNLLANKVFPSTTYIRTQEAFSQDPDIFHELFGHCPMLLDNDYSCFLTNIAKFALKCSFQEQMVLQRFLWYTLEVGLIQTSDGLRIYGGALISSPQEAVYSLESNKPERKPFNLLDVARSPYRADLMQDTYYFINDFEDLYNLKFSLNKLTNVINGIKKMREYPAKFKIENNKYTNVNILDTSTHALLVE